MGCSLSFEGKRMVGLDLPLSGGAASEAPPRHPAYSLGCKRVMSGPWRLAIGRCYVTLNDHNNFHSPPGFICGHTTQETEGCQHHIG